MNENSPRAYLSTSSRPLFTVSDLCTIGYGIRYGKFFSSHDLPEGPDDAGIQLGERAKSDQESYAPPT